MTTEEPMLTTEDVAKYLKVDVVTVRRLVTRGELAAYKVGSEYRFTKDDLLDYLKRQYSPARPQRPVPAAGGGFPAFDFQNWISVWTPFASRRAGGRPQARSPSGERFSAQARDALMAAQEQAERGGWARIETSHLLQGLALERHGAASRALTDFGLSPDQIQAALAARPDLAGEPRPPDKPIDLDSAVKRALEAAVDEVRRLGHNHLGTGHLLLGLLRDPKSKAVVLLSELKVQPEHLRTHVLKLLESDGE